MPVTPLVFVSFPFFNVLYGEIFLQEELYINNCSIPNFFLKIGFNFLK